MRKALLILLVATATNAAFSQEAPSSAVIKYDFFSPVAGCFGFSYETWYRNSTTLEINAGFIGVRLDDYFNSDRFIGGYASIGPRFYFKTDVIDGIDNYSDFRGFYMKPELLFNYFSFNDIYTQYDYNCDEFGNCIETITEFEVPGSDFSISLLMGLGHQWTFRDVVTMDLWFALGYGGNWVDSDTENLPPYNYYNTNRPFKYSFVRFGDSPMIFDGGLSIGLLIK
jgi:hypothetical protein